MIRRVVFAAAIACAASPGSAADSPAIEEVRRAWAACTAYRDAAADQWMGWRRIHDGGYADFFQFWDQGADGYGPSVLERTFLIDGIASETQTLCYRPDGSLAFAFTQMASPDMAEGAEGALTREGRIYVDPQGDVIRVLGKVVGNGFETTLDDPAHQLARGCWDLDLTPTRDAVHTAYLAELGDIEGSKPAYTPTPFDWCGAVK